MTPEQWQDKELQDLYSRTLMPAEGRMLSHAISRYIDLQELPQDDDPISSNLVHDIFFMQSANSRAQRLDAVHQRSQWFRGVFMVRQRPPSAVALRHTELGAFLQGGRGLWRWLIGGCWLTG